MARDLFEEAGITPGPAPASGGPRDLFAEAGIEIPTAPAAGSGSAAVDAGNAVGTGFFRGLTRMAGLPVDTILNALDLGKAAVGAPYIAASGKSPPSWLMPFDRSKVIGSGDHLLGLARRTAPGRAMVDPVNPDYEGGYLQAGGGALTGVMAPNSWGQAANQAGLALAGGLGGKAVYDATGNQALAITAGMLPTAAQQVLTTAAQRAVRGGEEGRREMAQRVQDLKNAGVEKPSLGLASGNKLIGGVENLLQSTPGAIGTMGRARDEALAGLQARTLDAADLASTNRGAAEAGRAIQAGVRGFKDQFKTQQSALYDRMDESIPRNAPVDVTNTKATLSALNADIPGAPALSKQFRNARIQAIEDAIKADTALGRNTVMGTQNGVQLPFEAVKKTRTLVGNEIADSTLASDVPRSKWNPLYGALTEDMKAAASAAGPDAQRAFNRATDYTRAGIERLDRVAPFVDGRAPEQTYTAVANQLKENTSTLQAIKKTLPDGTRGALAGTVIERLGKAKSGLQNDTTTAWNPETFLTNWNNMAPKARTELFSGFKNAPEVRQQVEAVARATSMMRDNSRLWANPSGTGANAAARGFLASVPTTAAAAAGGLLSPWVPAGIAGGLLVNRGLAEMLTRPGTVEWMLSRNRLPADMQASQGAALIGSGLLSEARE